MAENLPTFGDLYEFNTSSGNVTIPETSIILSKVISAFKATFGNSISTSTETIVGRQIETVSMLFKDVCGVNAQNASMMNLNLAAGAFLDNLGATFGVERFSGESDYSFRMRIKGSVAPGIGFAESIRRSVAGIGGGVDFVTVLDNGNQDPALLPVDENKNSFPHSVYVDAHSVYVSVKGGVSDAVVLDAINKSKSAGCGLTFVRPTQLFVSISVNVRDDYYVGTDIDGDTADAVVAYLLSRMSCVTVTKGEIISCIGAVGKSIIVDSVSFYTSDAAITEYNLGTAVDSLVVKPDRYIEVVESDISITVA